MSDTQPASPLEDEVEWQVALFALMPLILGAMTQPVGRVLDQPAKYRIWMRSSPILCAVDMLSIRHAERFFGDPKLLLHFKAELEQRFRDGDVTQILNDVERTALFRRMLILLGGVPCQTIKLAAMRGIPLTKGIRNDVLRLYAIRRSHQHLSVSHASRKNRRARRPQPAPC